MNPSFFNFYTALVPGGSLFSVPLDQCIQMARKMRPEEKRHGEVMPRTANTHSGTLGSVPSTFATGYRYIGLGYTTAFDAAVPPLSARHAHEEFEDTPCIDKGFYVLMGNNHYINVFAWGLVTSRR